jgi:hypothetical protein
MNELQSGTSSTSNTYKFKIKDSLFVPPLVEEFKFQIISSMKNRGRDRDRMHIELEIISTRHEILNYNCQLEIESQKYIIFKFANPIENKKVENLSVFNKRKYKPLNPNQNRNINKLVQEWNKLPIEKIGVEYLISIGKYFERRERIWVLNSFYSILTYVEKEDLPVSRTEVDSEKNYVFENDYRQSIELFFDGTYQNYQLFKQFILFLNHIFYTHGFIFGVEDVESEPDKAVFIFYKKNVNEIAVLLKIVIDKSTQKIIVDENEELIYNRNKNCWESERYRFCEQGIFILDQNKIYKLIWEETIFFDYEQLSLNNVKSLKKILNVPSGFDNQQETQSVKKKTNLN